MEITMMNNIGILRFPVPNKFRQGINEIEYVRVNFEIEMVAFEGSSFPYCQSDEYLEWGILDVTGSEYVRKYLLKSIR